MVGQERREQVVRVCADSGMELMEVESAAEPLLGAQTVPHVKAFGVLPAVGGLSGEGSASPPSRFLLCQRSLPRFGYPSEPRRHYILDTFLNWLIEKCLLNHGRYS